MRCDHDADLARLDERVKRAESWIENFNAEKAAREERAYERITLAIQAGVSGAVGWVIGHFTVHFHK